MVTDRFKAQSAYQAKMLGLQDAQVTWVEHPIADNTQDMIYSKAEKSLESIVEQLSIAGSRPLRDIPLQARDRKSVV